MNLLWGDSLQTWTFWQYWLFRDFSSHTKMIHPVWNSKGLTLFCCVFIAGRLERLETGVKTSKRRLLICWENKGLALVQRKLKTVTVLVLDLYVNFILFHAITIKWNQFWMYMNMAMLYFYVLWTLEYRKIFLGNYKMTRLSCYLENPMLILSYKRDCLDCRLRAIKW